MQRKFCTKNPAIFLAVLRTGRQNRQRAQPRLSIQSQTWPDPFIVDDQRSVYGVGACSVDRHISGAVAVAVGVNAGDIGPRHADRYPLLIGQLGVGHRRHHRQHPGIRFSRIGPGLGIIVGQIQRFLNIGFLFGGRHDSDIGSRFLCCSGLGCGIGFLPAGAKGQKHGTGHQQRRQSFVQDKNLPVHFMEPLLYRMENEICLIES